MYIGRIGMILFFKYKKNQEQGATHHLRFRLLLASNVSRDVYHKCIASNDTSWHLGVQTSYICTYCMYKYKYCTRSQARDSK